MTSKNIASNLYVSSQTLTHISLYVILTVSLSYGRCTKLHLTDLFL
jgi:hypothetical protein